MDNPLHSTGSAKMPYLDGSESKALNRPSALDFAKNMLEYDIISIDVFDTLLLRPFSEPHHLFMIIGEKLNCTNFMSIRMKAEKEARYQAEIRKGNKEVTLYDIYELIELQTGIDKRYGVQVEFQTELEFCFANPYMKDVFELLKSQDKKMIAISDSYLTKSMVVKLLENAGFSGFLDVFVSSENNGSKQDQQLFKIALQKLGKDIRLVHVGENIESDIKNAQELGIATRYYNNVHETGNQFRSDGMSELIGSTYSGIVNTHLHNGSKQYTPHYEYGFIYGGLYILGYCQWIYDYAKQNNIDKVLFLSRDGDIYRKVFNFLYTDIDHEYVYWSRIANIKYTIEKNRYDFLKRMVKHKANGVLAITIKGLLESLELDDMVDLLPLYQLKQNDLIHKGNVKIIQTFFVENWDQVVKKLSEDNELVKGYFLSILGGSKKVAVVDVGWVGSGGSGIKYLIEEKWKLNCEVHSLVAGCRHSNHTGNLTQIMKKDIAAYIFSRMYNRNLYDIHSSKKHINVFFELFTQACYPSFSGFKKTDDSFKFLFDVPEVENYKIIKQIHQGIFDFVRLYKNAFSNYEYLFNISGYDAYLPFKMIIKDLRFIKNYFGSLRFSRGVIADTENQTFETLNEIMDQAELCHQNHLNENSSIENSAHFSNDIDYSMTYHYEYALKIIHDLFSPPAIYEMNTDKLLLENLLNIFENRINLSVNSIKNLRQIPGKSVVLIDDFNHGALPEPKEMINFLKSADKESVIIFLNSNKEYLFYNYPDKEILEFIVPVEILRYNAADETQQDSKTIFLYSKRKDRRNMVNQQSFEKTLDGSNEKIIVKKMSEEQLRIKVLEGILEATEKRLEHYIKLESELRTKLNMKMTE
ncbi:HAD family hydrolase [Neobacillus kokaensis]|uniref:HAD family hydrolase n=1 Tax=Neobacillus kokaensis TaxID=2759023 RepID=A0ABQ3N3N2_9BACI|nr:HAD-IA family hydrolase [Neobacillus kokaensis]GHH99533.1 hypothetical protein AM1BK_30760 [Neobacillus kokaensis]